MDHGTPWWNMQAAAGWTWLTVWLMKQGIELHWSGYRHPQTQGKVERFHGELAAGVAAPRMPAQGTASVAGSVSLGIQPCAPARSAGDEHAGATVWQKSERRYDPHPPLGNIRRERGYGKLTAPASYGARIGTGKSAEPGGRMGAAGTIERADLGLLLPHPGA